ncbi:hypothetical protein GCM10022233_69470 [Streptomyces shaanxiensis]|uniref:Uncharacterized protein n=1 Tax=Streptomyces shaanxiensis TaxID=653357 RepID=A0ABP7W2S0_9ACTN
MEATPPPTELPFVSPQDRHGSGANLTPHHRGQSLPGPDPAALAEELAVRGLKVSGGTAFGALHRPEAWDEMLAHVRQVAELTAAGGPSPVCWPRP